MSDVRARLWIIITAGSRHLSLTDGGSVRGVGFMTQNSTVDLVFDMFWIACIVYGMLNDNIPFLLGTIAYQTLSIKADARLRG